MPVPLVPDVPNVPLVPSAEDECGGVRFSIDNLQFIPALYKITYNLGLNYKLCRIVKQKIWKRGPKTG